MRQRKQQVVAKENQFYMQLMQQALPAETTPPIEQTEAPANAIVPAQPVQNNNKIHSNRWVSCYFLLLQFYANTLMKIIVPFKVQSESVEYVDSKKSTKCKLSFK